MDWFIFFLFFTKYPFIFLSLPGLDHIVACNLRIFHLIFGKFHFPLISAMSLLQINPLYNAKLVQSSLDSVFWYFRCGWASSWSCRCHWICFYRISNIQGMLYCCMRYSRSTALFSKDPLRWSKWPCDNDLQRSVPSTGTDKCYIHFKNAL